MLTRSVCLPACVCLSVCRLSVSPFVISKTGALILIRPAVLDVSHILDLF